MIDRITEIRRGRVYHDGQRVESKKDSMRYEPYDKVP